MNKLVSVVIPNYNYARYVGAAIESVLRQTYSPVEIVVVDNGSTDNSLAVLEKFGNKIRLIAQENRGQAGSRNRGVAEAKGEFIAFLDADDLWKPDKLEKQMHCFEDPEVALVYCSVERVDAELKRLGISTAEKSGWLLRDFALSPAAVIQGGESTAIVRKSALEAAGEFDARLSISTGWDMWRRIACRGKIAAVAEPLTLYRQHGNNASKGLATFEQDTRLKLEKLFSDPAAAEVHAFRRRSYAAHFVALSGAYFQAGQIIPAIRLSLRALLYWPPAALYALALPWRLFRRFALE